MAQTDPKNLGTIVGVWAHPDDEVYLAGGIMAAAVAAGQRVVCVTATKGEAGYPDDDLRSDDAKAQQREQEMKACLSVLGVTEHHWLGHADGACADVDVESAVTPLITLLSSVRPDTVLTFGPDGMTGHPDHIAAGRWTTEAFKRAVTWPAQLLYATKTGDWNRRFFDLVDPSMVMMVEGMEPPAVADSELAFRLDLAGDALEAKVNALAAQASQTTPLRTLAGEEGYRDLVREEFFRVAG